MDACIRPNARYRPRSHRTRAPLEKRDAETYIVPNAARAVLEPNGGGVFVGFEDGSVAAWLSHGVGWGWQHASFGRSQSHGSVKCIDVGDAPNGVALVAGFQDGMVGDWLIDVGDLEPTSMCSWRAHAEAPVASWPYSGVESVAFTHSHVVTGGQDSNACLWSRDRPRTAVQHMHGAHGGAVTVVGIQTEGENVLSATGGQDGVVKLWRHRQDVADFDGAVLPLHQRDWDKAEICAPIPTCITLDTQRHLFTGGDDGMVRLWDMMAHRAKRRFGTGEDGVPGVSAVSVDVHEWCTQVASGTDDGAVVIWDVRTKDSVESFQAHSLTVLSLAIRGHRALTASVAGSAALWDLRSTSKALEAIELRLPLLEGQQPIVDHEQPHETLSRSLVQAPDTRLPVAASLRRDAIEWLERHPDGGNDVPAPSICVVNKVRHSDGDADFVAVV